jgi:hypothetical protein
MKTNNAKTMMIVSPFYSRGFALPYLFADFGCALRVVFRLSAPVLYLLRMGWIEVRVAARGV